MTIPPVAPPSPPRAWPRLLAVSARTVSRFKASAPRPDSSRFIALLLFFRGSVPRVLGEERAAPRKSQAGGAAAAVCRRDEAIGGTSFVPSSMKRQYRLD